MSQAKKMRFLARGREQMWVVFGCEEEYGKMICGARENSALKHVKLELSLLKKCILLLFLLKHFMYMSL